MEEKIINILKKQNGKPISFSNVFKYGGFKNSQREEFSKIIDKLQWQGKMKKEGIRFVLPQFSKKSEEKLIPAEIVKIATSFGFAKPEDEELQDFFIPGRGLMGAMVGDKVLIEEKRSLGQSPEGLVKEITKEGKGALIGVLERENGNFYLHPDRMEIPIVIKDKEVKNAKLGDKILARIVKRGRSHFDHQAEVVKVYGDGSRADVAKEAVLDEYNLVKEFSSHVLSEANIVSDIEITKNQRSNRLDLSGSSIFTIDGADAKDLDDAISLEKIKDYYRLGVHIADVSYYVKPKSALDDEAFSRGTSIYYADEVIPMLPEALSNGICSLTPKEDRLAFSVFINIDKKGKIKDYKFHKSIINSKIKGVYSEINDIISYEEAIDVREKYKEVYDTIFLMKELSDILEARRKQRGTFDINSKESKIIIENGVAVDILSRQTGLAEGIIESFMLTANEVAADFALSHEMPFIHRVHENPALEKIKELKEDFKLLGININVNTDGSVNHKEFNRILNEAKGTELETVINYRVLRTMAKAKYSEKPIGHFGLALEKYVHFTSPIRRYPDLVDHRILTDYLLGPVSKNKEKSFHSFVKKAAAQSTAREITAMGIERDCEDIYKAEYMNNFLGESFEGLIVSATNSGVFVELGNTVQGRIAVETLDKGEYQLEGNIRLRNLRTKKTYSVGDRLEIVVARADVNTGNVDFLTKEYYKKNFSQRAI